MTPLERIQVDLSPFEKLQLLRLELEDREKELSQVTSEIRDKLQQWELQKYLESLSPFYAANPREGLPTREEIEALETRRQQLHELKETIEATIPTLLSADQSSAPASAGAPSPSAGPARKRRFESFDDFRASQ